jgi:hypothetical protein
MNMPAATGRGRRRLWAAAAIAIAAVVVGAWVLQGRYSSAVGSSKGAPAAAYSITVERDGKTLKTYDLVTLHALPQSRVVIDGKEQAGPSLVTLLRDAGAVGYDSVVVRGAGLRDKGELTLTAAQVRRRAQLDFSDRGTVKVCGPALYHAEWVRDVLTIDAR